MKKIVIKGGEFYKAYLVASYQNVSLSANQFLRLVENPKADALYLFKINSNIASVMLIHNGSYIVRVRPETWLEDSEYVARAISDSVPIQFKSNQNITISISVYEYRRYIPVRLCISGYTAYDFILNEFAAIYQFPEFVIGKTYKVRVTPQYSGRFTFYQSEQQQYDNNSVVSGETYEFEYVAAGTDNPKVRTWVNDTCFLSLEINEK